MAETAVQVAIRKELERRGAWVMKVHGSPFQRRGVPDLIGCYRGRFFGIETKCVGSSSSKIQEFVQREIANAGGMTGEATSLEEALRVIGEV